MKPGDIYQTEFPNGWKIDLIYREDGLWFIGAQRGKRGFSVLGDQGESREEIVLAALSHIAQIDAKEGQ